MEPAKKTTSRPADARVKLAIRRTVLAADRTLLAWVRTSLALMTFGFSIYKFFQYLFDSGAMEGDWRPNGPRRFGMTLVSIATILLAMQTWQYYELLKRMSLEEKSKVPKTPALIAGVLVSLLGVLALLSIVLNVPFL